MHSPRGQIHDVKALLIGKLPLLVTSLLAFPVAQRQGTQLPFSGQLGLFCCFLVWFCLLFLSKLLLHRPGWSQIVDPPPSASWGPGLQVWVTTSCWCRGCLLSEGPLNCADPQCCSPAILAELQQTTPHTNGLQVLLWSSVYCVEISRSSYREARRSPILAYLPPSCIFLILCLAHSLTPAFLCYAFFHHLKSEMRQGPENTIWSRSLVRV